MTSPQELLLALLRRDARNMSVPVFPLEAWDGLLDVAPRDLHPYLGWRMAECPDGTGVPPALLQALERMRRGAAMSHLPRHAMLRRIARTLDREGIPFVVLKGAALAHLAYPDPALRPMGDIDIWTRPAFLDRAAAAILADGIAYSSRMEARRAAANPLEEDSTRVFEAPGTPVVLELHGEVRSMLATAPSWSDTAWERAVPRDLGGLTARVPHAEDMLTHLAIHASAHHRFEMGLRPLLDIALWLEREGAGIDWSAATERWRRDGCLTWTYLTLVLAKDLLGAPVPAAFLEQAAAPPHFEELRALALAQVLDAASTLPPTLAKLAVTPTIRGRGRWLLHRLTAWYWEGPPGSHRAPLEVVREATRRMSSDLRTKLPAYLRGWRDGSLRGAEYRRRQLLAAGRQRLADLVHQAEPPRHESQERA